MPVGQDFWSSRYDHLKAMSRCGSRLQCCSTIRLRDSRARYAPPTRSTCSPSQAALSVGAGLSGFWRRSAYLTGRGRSLIDVWFARVFCLACARSQGQYEKLMSESQASRAQARLWATMATARCGRASRQRRLKRRGCLAQVLIWPCRISLLLLYDWCWGRWSG